MRLLILDDDALIADFVAAVASEDGWTVDKTTSIDAFWSRFADHLPDAVLIDMQLGESDGIEQLRRLSREAYAGSVALMSGVEYRVLASAQGVGRSLGLVVHAVIEKPARVSRIRAVLAGMRPVAAPRLAAELPSDPDDLAQGTVAPRALSPAMVVEAIDAGQMHLYLQPIVSSMTQEIIGAEGLARWLHPIDGLLMPERFIPIAEEDIAAIERLTTWAINTAAEHYRSLAALGIAVPINVNVSGRNLAALDFPDRIAAMLDDAGVPCAAIRLEITETVAALDRRLAGDILTRLRLKGIGLSIDDFGTGHATLESLRSMPFSTIKIDRGFVGDLLTSEDSFAIVRSIIDLAHTMGMTAVAEGVEDKRVADCLTELGIDAMQGFCFAQALPMEAFIARMQA